MLNPPPFPGPAAPPCPMLRVPDTPAVILNPPRKHKPARPPEAKHETGLPKHETNPKLNRQARNVLPTQGCLFPRLPIFVLVSCIGMRISCFPPGGWQTNGGKRMRTPDREGRRLRRPRSRSATTCGAAAFSNASARHVVAVAPPRDPEPASTNPSEPRNRRPSALPNLGTCKPPNL
jgi:hypothetical protein